MTTLRVSVACAVAAASAAPALAQTAENGAPAGRAAGLYARFGVGAAFANDLEQDLTFGPIVTLAASPPTPIETEIDTSAVGAFAVGYQYPGNTRTELEYRFASADAAAVEAGPGDRAQPDDAFRVHLLTSNVYYDFRNSSRFTPFVGVGVGGAFVDNGLGQTDAAFAYQGRAGVEAALTDRNALSVEYVYARTRELTFGPVEFDETNADEVRIDGDVYAASTVLISFRRTF
ncbi:MAG: outer membrane protein [Parvularculaceae bacterium]